MAYTRYSAGGYGGINYWVQVNEQPGGYTRIFDNWFVSDYMQPAGGYALYYRITEDTSTNMLLNLRMQVKIVGATYNSAYIYNGYGWGFQIYINGVRADMNIKDPNTDYWNGTAANQWRETNIRVPKTPNGVYTVWINPYNNGGVLGIPEAGYWDPAVRINFNGPKSATTPNIAIDSLNGVGIARGEGNYSISVNANQELTIGYSAWAGAISSDACSIDAWVRKSDMATPNLSWKTVLNDGNGKPAGSVKYKQYNNSGNSATLMGSGVSFAYDNKYVWLYAQRHHSITAVKSPEIVHTNIRLIRVLYTPIRSVSITTTVQSIYDDMQNIPLSWSYPTPSSLINQYGIVSGYEVRIIRVSDGAVIYNQSTTGTSFTIPKTAYKPLVRYYVQICPYYLNGSSKSFGPIQNTIQFIAVTKLNPPTINYPITGSGCTWVGNKIRLCFQLPYDVDSVGIEDSYLYRDIEVVINSNTYLFSTNKAMFSVSNLKHNIRVAFSSKSVNIPFSTTYAIKVRVQKNYGNFKWSDYSTISLSAIALPTVPTFSGEIMSAHYTQIRTIVNGMRRCFLPSGTAISLPTISRETMIRRSDFQSIYNELLAISQLIDTWGSYTNNAIKVNFQTNNLFSPKTEYITNIENDTNPIGDNYFIKSYNWIRYYG